MVVVGEDVGDVVEVDHLVPLDDLVDVVGHDQVRHTENWFAKFSCSHFLLLKGPIELLHSHNQRAVWL